MSVTKNHSPAIPIPKMGKVMDPAKQRAINAIAYAAIGTLLVVVAVIVFSSFLGGSIPPANEPPVIIEQPETTPTAGTPVPTAVPITEPTITPTIEPTAVPTVVPTSKPTEKPTSEPTATNSPISAPDNFIVADEHWEFASFLRKADGTLFNGVIGFSDVSVGSKIYAPISGYIHILSSGEGDRSLVELIITENKKWSASDQSGRYIVFSAKEFELLDTGLKDEQPFVEKGKAFAKVTNNAELFPGFYDRKQVLLVAFDKEWRDMLDSSITDVKEYVIAAIERLN